MTLLFRTITSNPLYDGYGGGDFDASVFSREDNDLVLTFSGVGEDEIITIKDAYDDDPNTATGNMAFTISVEYFNTTGISGTVGIGSYIQVDDGLWSALT